MSDSSYTNIVTTVGTLGTLFLIGWNVFVWNQKKKQDEKLTLKVVIKNKQIQYKKGLPVGFVRNLPHRMLYIQNNGKVNVQILSCFIDSASIENSPTIKEPNNIIGAKIGSGNSVSAQIIEGYEFSNILIGKNIRIKCRLDSGKIAEEEYTLSEEME